MWAPTGGEVELHIDVLTPVMMHRILHQGDGGLVVHLELGCEDGSFDELSQPNCLARSSCSRNVFCLAGRQRDYLLLRRLPCNRPTYKEEDEAAGALPVIDISSQVTIGVTHQLRSAFILPSGMVVQAPMQCPCHIA